MAETHRDEIAKLEALHASHPEGRVFTHLADAYRRAGDVARAREILDEGLSRHPDYPSAHVVMGRLLAETGEVEQAAAAFRRVLGLDRHNVVALRSLAEMAERAGRLREALHYYEELSRVDPANESLLGQVRDLEAAVGTEPSLASWTSDEPQPMTSLPDPEADAAAPAALVGPEPAGADETFPADSYASALDESLAGEWVPQDRWDRFARGDAAESATAGQPGGELQPGNQPEAEGEQATEGEQVTEGERESESRQEPAWAPDAYGDVAPDTPGAEELEAGIGDAPGTGDALDFGEALEIESVVEIVAEIAPEAPEWQHGDVAIDGIVIEETVVTRIEVEPGPGDVPLDDVDEGEVIDEWVTETMAEVYAAQGLTERAVEVYRLLRRSRPADGRISARLAELEEALSGPATPDVSSFADDDDDDGAAAREAWLASVESAWTGGTGVDTSADETLYAWAASEADTHADGSTAGDLFRALLGWRPTMPAGVPTSHVPEAELDPSAGAHIDVAELLLEEEVVESAMPRPGAGAAGDAGSVESVFEELFGDRGMESQVPAEASPAPPPGGPAAVPLPRPVDQAETEQDLEMFRTWLQSLKK